MKRVILLPLLIVMSSFLFSQQITLNACNNLLDNDDYVFEQSGIVDGHNTYQTVSDPSSGSRDCSGIGFCQLRIVWNTTNSRWEIIADDGNGGFSNTYTLYYNTQNTMPDPPDLTNGTWEEAITVTQSQCGSINSFSGNVLSIENAQIDAQFRVYPNPVNETLYIEGLSLDDITSIILYDVLGKKVVSCLGSTQSINVSNLRNGIYFLKIELSDREIKRKIIVE